MSPERFEAITSKYTRLRVAIVGDFCLDRYLEIDPGRREVSIETGLRVYNVQNVRSQPGGAGTILNNLSALGMRQIFPIGFCGEDGEGYELRRALADRHGVELDYFFQTPERRTFTYCKPLVLEPGQAPRELNRFDQKNWTATPLTVSTRISQALDSVSSNVDALILLNQVEQPETGVLTRLVLETAANIARIRPELAIVADSRTGFGNFPPVIFKMNADELITFTGIKAESSLSEIESATQRMAQRNNHPVFITMAERGIMAASPDGQIHHVATLPVHGPIDIVGAGDAVTANLTIALAAGASLIEALELANAAASVVIHQLGTTGTASIHQLRQALTSSAS